MKNVTLELFPELHTLQVDERDHEQVRRVLTMPLGALAERASQGVVHLRLPGGDTFRAFVDTPSGYEADSHPTIAIAGEAGNGLMGASAKTLNVGVVARSLALRDAIDPHARVAVLPNNTIGEPNLAFSRDEHRQLTRGSLAPYRHRLETLVGEADGPVYGFGPSQGAAIMGDYAAYPDTRIQALSVLEAPNVVDRSLLAVGQAFGRDGSHFTEVFQANTDDEPTEAVNRHIQNAIGSRGMARFGVGLLDQTNIQTFRHLSRNTLGDHIAGALEKNVGVHHAWARKGKTSPHEANQKVARRFADNPLYGSTVFESWTADHSISNAYLVCIAGMREAVARRVNAES